MESRLVSELRAAIVAEGMRVDHISLKVQSARMGDRGPREPWLLVFLTVDGREIDISGLESAWLPADRQARALKYVLSKPPDAFPLSEALHYRAQTIAEETAANTLKFNA